MPNIVWFLLGSFIVVAAVLSSQPSTAKQDVFLYVDQQQNVSEYYLVNYSYDKIVKLDWYINANQTNYSYSVFGYYDNIWKITMHKHTCSNLCNDSAVFSYNDIVVNYCEINIWRYPSNMSYALIFNLSVLITYEGNAMTNPTNPHDPTSPKDASFRLGIGAIVGITVGCCSVVGLVVAAAVYFYRKYINNYARN